MPTTTSAVYLPRRKAYRYDGTDSPSGVELVTNGTFDTDTDWTKGTGWTISGGTAVATSATAFSELLQANIGLSAGSVYRVTVDATVTTGDAALFAGASGDASVRISIPSTGSYSATITATSIDRILVRAGGSGFTHNRQRIRPRVAAKLRSRRHPA